MIRTLTDQWIFAREYYRTRRSIGAIAPSSRHLAMALTEPMRRASGPRRILEVGAGTGAITSHIVRHLRPGDTFHAVEINDKFVAVLRKRMETDPRFRRVAHQMSVLHQPVQDVPVDQPYDFIVCGLPFNSFSIDLVKNIFRHFQDLLHPQGVLTNFEYLWIREVSALVIPPEERRRIARVGKLLAGYFKRHEFRRQTVLVNVPPALVHYLQFAPKTVPILSITSNVATPEATNITT